MYRPFGVLRLVAAFLEVDLSTGLGQVFEKSNTGKAATSRSTPKVSVRSAHIDLIPGGSSYRITESPLLLVGSFEGVIIKSVECDLIETAALVPIERSIQQRSMEVVIKVSIFHKPRLRCLQIYGKRTR